jgi:hypothetical protein
MSTELRLAAILILIASVFGVGVRYGSTTKQAEWDADKIASKDATSRALQAAASAIAQIDIKQQTIVQKVQHEVQTKTVYRDCVIPDDGVRLLNDAVESRDKSAGGDGVQAAP